MSNAGHAETGEDVARPLVSVIIPTHDRRHLLGTAIESVLAQEPIGGRIELIVVDDASSDGSAEVVARYPAAKYLRSEARNVSAARNAGIAAARGDWLAFLDDDDAWLPHKLRRTLAAAADDPGARVVMSAAYSCNATLEPSYVWRPPAEKRRGGMYQGFLENVMTPSAIVVHKSVFETIGLFDESAYRSEDRELCLRAARAGLRFLVLDEPLVFYRRPTRIDGDQLVATFRATLALLRREFAERHPDQPSLWQCKAYEFNLRRWYAKALLEGSREQKLDGNAAEASRFDRLALAVSPLHWTYHRLLRRRRAARQAATEPSAAVNVFK
ncbi:MAG TPA: glycosyltransferase [Polyangiaceae bacterium]|nr:glycosyltransferase [Polyangiaceae bacterium]